MKSLSTCWNSGNIQESEHWYGEEMMQLKRNSRNLNTSWNVQYLLVTFKISFEIYV